MKTCCFIGHRKISVDNTLSCIIKSEILWLIKQGITTFYFGSRSNFNDICLKIVTQFKQDYPELTRIFVRAEYEYIDKDYENYLLNRYDSTYFSKLAHNAGKLVYIKRNQEIINDSDVCVFYFDKNYKISHNRSSGTEIAYDYANHKKKRIINIFELIQK